MSPRDAALIKHNFQLRQTTKARKIALETKPACWADLWRDIVKFAWGAAFTVINLRNAYNIGRKKANPLR